MPLHLSGTAGNKHFAAKEYPKAVKKYTAALASKGLSEEDAAVILANRSASYTILNKYDLAVADAQHAAERCPRWAKAQVRLVEALLRKHAFQQAEAAWKLAIEYSENEADRARYTTLMEQASQAAAKSQEKNKPRQGIYAKLDSPDNTWFAKLHHVLGEGGPRPPILPPMPMEGLDLSCYVWRSCEASWKAIDEGVELTPGGQAKIPLFDPHTLTGLVDAILTDHVGFHVTWTPKDGISLRIKLTHILNEEEKHGDFAKYFDGTWNRARIIDDLDKQIAAKGRRFVRRLASGLINGRIIRAFLALTEAQWGVAAETARLAVEIHDAGNSKWAHEALDVRGNVFSPTLVRGTRLQFLRTLVSGRMAAKTPAAKRAFPASDIEDAVRAVLDSQIPESFWPAENVGQRLRLPFDRLPRWESIAAFGFAHNFRAMEPLKHVVPGAVVFANLEQAREAAKFYDKAATLMPDDFHKKGMTMWSALHAHLRAGDLCTGSVLDRFAAAERVDTILEPHCKRTVRDHFAAFRSHLLTRTCLLPSWSSVTQH
ncbi:hypothetical protein JCM3774_002917 [Rhodotorula dairenensis]